MTRNRFFAATLGTFGLPLAACGAMILAGCAHDKPVAATPAKAPVSVSRSISSGNFRAVILTDVDADGQLDVVAGGRSPTTVAISYGDGKGAISDTSYLPISGDVQAVAVADVDNDGRKDIVVSIQRAASGIQVWKKTANREWVRANGPTSLYQYQGIETADVNRDGNIDIIAANATSEIEGGVQVWLGDGRGGWPVQSGPTVSGIHMDVAVADLNGDGRLDLAAAGWGKEGSLRVWFGDGTGDWSVAFELATGSFYGVRAADVDMDGHPDLVAATYRNGLKIFRGDGTGRFQPMPPPADQGSFWDTLVTDLNADGEPDLLASSNDGNGMRAWTLKDGRRWQKIDGRFPDTGTYFELAGGDFNGDGVADICAAGDGDGVQFWHGRQEDLYPASTASKVVSAAAAKQDRIAAVEGNEVYTTVMGFPEYKIGPGDVLEITLWQRTKPDREEVLVRPDGKISFGFIDDLQVNQMTPTQLDELLTRNYRRYVKDPRIDVVVKTPNSKFVAVTGAIGGGIRTSGAGVGTGKYPLSGKTTLMEMVARAGGPSRDANLREVRIRRKSGETFALNLYRAIYQ
jgi:protein involved in polysaccharide export with SLBB domain